MDKTLIAPGQIVQAGDKTGKILSIDRIFIQGTNLLVSVYCDDLDQGSDPVYRFPTVLWSDGSPAIDEDASER